jgi:hypothetical protein
MRIDLVEGWTAPLDFVLKADGVAVNLTGQDVTLVLNTAAGVAIDTSADVQVVEAASGRVRYTPAVGAIRNADGPLKARWRVSDGGAVVFFPAGVPDQWRVYLP